MNFAPATLKSPHNRIRNIFGKTISIIGPLFMAAAMITLGCSHAADMSLTNAESITSPDHPDTNLFIHNMDELDDKYKLAVGDHFNFQVLEDEDPAQSLLITDSGNAEIPYIGRFPAAGKTCKQLAEQLKAALEKKYYYRATVIISVDSMLTRGVIYIAGAVQKPGPMEMPRDEALTVSKAILRAGGFSDFADEKNVRVTRKSEDNSKKPQTFIVDVSQVLDKGKIDKDKLVESGDLIYVPERVFRF